jgi:hypothetical protein
VRRVIHWRNPGGIFPVFTAAPARHIVEAVVPVVEVLGLGIDDAAEIALLVALATVEDAGVIIAGFAQHIYFLAVLDGVD